MKGDSISFYPSALRQSSVQAWLPAPNDDKNLSFDYTPTFAEASEGKQERFRAGQKLGRRRADDG